MNVGFSDGTAKQNKAAYAAIVYQGDLKMVRGLTFFFAMALSVFSSAAMAQTGTEATTQPIAAKPKFKLASYNTEYSSAYSGGGSCATCNSGGGDSFAYAGAGGAVGGPHAMAYGRVWGGAQSNRDCSRFYHYPYVYYPQNFRGSDYYRSSDSMYNRYPPEMQIPVYNRHWHNYYPSSRRYHWGHHFILDVF